MKYILQTDYYMHAMRVDATRLVALIRVGSIAADSPSYYKLIYNELMRAYTYCRMGAGLLTSVCKQSL